MAPGQKLNKTLREPFVRPPCESAGDSGTDLRTVSCQDFPLSTCQCDLLLDCTFEVSYKIRRLQLQEDLLGPKISYGGGGGGVTLCVVVLLRPTVAARV